MYFSKTISCGGLLKRLKDASISDCNSLSTNFVDRSSHGELTFSFNPICPETTPSIANSPRPILEGWNKIVEKFEEKYTQIYIQSDMKKKAHLDCIEEGSNLIHEPKAKWCHVLLLDALVHSAHNYTFSALVESSVRRRKFNQHLELRNSILDVYGKSAVGTYSKSTSECILASDGVVTPDLSDRDLISADLLPISSVDRPHQLHKSNVNLISPEIHDRELYLSHTSTSSSNISGGQSQTKKNKKRKHASCVRGRYSVGDTDDAEDEHLFANILSLLADSPQSITTANEPDDVIDRGLKKAVKAAANGFVIDIGTAIALRRPNQWDSHENFQEYLLSLAGTDKSSKRFQTVVNDLCRKLSAHGSDTNNDRRSLKKSESKQSTSESPCHPQHFRSDLMSIIAAVIMKVCSAPEQGMVDEERLHDSEPTYQSLSGSLSPSPLSTLPDFDFYTIESDFKGDYISSANNLPPFYGHESAESGTRVESNEMQQIKEEPHPSSECKRSDSSSFVRSLYIIPADLPEGQDSNSEESDEDESCPMRNEDRCADTEKAFTSLFQGTQECNYCHYGEITQNSFPSFNEVWDDFSRNPNCM